MYGTYLCIKEVMKNHGCRLPNYHASKAGQTQAFDTSHFYMLRGIYLQLGLPILFTTAHNRSEPISRIPPASSKN